MAASVRAYETDAVLVTFEARRCIHAARCVTELAEVFDTGKRPWIQPANADPDRVVEVVGHCPTGALRVERRDGGAGEVVPATTTVRETRNGPLYVNGPSTLLDADGEVIESGPRYALCRCGASSNRPFCDGSHREAGFRTTG